MKDLIKGFYEAFSKLDAEGMQAFYHEDIQFKDPAFGKLIGKDAADMWRMLCANAKDLEISFSDVEADEEKGLAKWEAHYTFSKTGRKVHNIVLAKFRFKDGKIISHVDSFNLHKWSKQAMGFKGWLLGGTHFFKEQLQKQTKRMLRKYQSKQ